MLTLLKCFSYCLGCGATNLSLLVFSITTSILIYCCCPGEAGEGETACCGLPSIFKKVSVRPPDLLKDNKPSMCLCNEQGKVMIEKLLNATIGLGSFIWLVIGSIYVFGVDPISFEDPNMPDYCDYAPYMYAYVMTIIGEDHHLNIESTMQIIFSQKCTFEQGKCLGR